MKKEKNTMTYSFRLIFLRLLRILKSQMAAGVKNVLVVRPNERAFELGRFHVRGLHCAPHN